jgi:hypothetical protein
VCAVESSVDVSDIHSLDELFPLYSKGGSNNGALSQAFPLAASEQYILDPQKVCLFGTNHKFTVIVYDPKKCREGLIVSSSLHAGLSHRWNKMPSFKCLKDLASSRGKDFLLQRIYQHPIRLNSKAEMTFQQFNGNFSKLAMSLISESGYVNYDLSRSMYATILSSTRFVSVKKERSYSHYTVNDIIEILSSSKDIVKESFPVAGSLEYDPNMRVLRIVSPDSGYNVILHCNSMSEREKMDMARLNVYNRSRNKRMWNCVYKITRDRTGGGCMRLKNLKIAIPEGANQAPIPNPKANRYLVLDQGLFAFMLICRNCWG